MFCFEMLGWRSCRTKGSDVDILFRTGGLSDNPVPDTEYVCSGGRTNIRMLGQHKV